MRPHRFVFCAVPLVLLFVACNAPSDPQRQDDELRDAPPPGCRVVHASAFANGPALSPAAYGQQPTFVGRLDASLGGGADDDVRIRVDAATERGRYDLAAPGATSCYEKGRVCVTALEDIDPATGRAARTFAAVRGSVAIGDRRTPDQTNGSITGVELREVEIATTNRPWRAATLVPNGACLWIPAADFDTRRPDGCDPLGADTCGAGKACIVENAAGSDGTCLPAGEEPTGAECTHHDGGSTCAPGHWCIALDEGPARCVRQCDVLAAYSGCPDGTTCGAFGLCFAPAAIDPAAIGEPCASEGATCGRDGARGLCFTLFDSQSQPSPDGPHCWGYGRARSACAPGEDLGYQSFSGGRDRSLGICTTVLP